MSQHCKARWDWMKKKVACLSASNWIKTISPFFTRLVGILALTRRLQSTPEVRFVGQLLNWILPINGYKVYCWRKKLQGNLKELDKRCKDLISNDIKRIKDKATEELKRTRVVKEKKIQDEERKSLKLDEWSKECQESHTRLTETNKEFDELLTE